MLEGFKYLPELLSKSQQLTLRDELYEIIKKSPIYKPTMPRTGKPLSVSMTNCGEYGWVSDKDNGYRYQKHHPITGEKWQKMPDTLLKLWQSHANYPHPTECCLINKYDKDTKLSLHVDMDEADRSAPIMIVSLGDMALFRIGGLKRGDKASSFKTSSGDVTILGGQARYAYHGIGRIYHNTSTLLNGGGRISLSLRRVTKP